MSSTPTLSPQTTRASVTTWLGVLFILVVGLMALGSFVRISEAGLTLVGWPMVGGQLIPPVTESGWQQHFEMYLDELARLQGMKEEGVAGIGSLPPAPESVAAFRAAYMTTFAHRFLAAVVGLIGLACTVVLLRKAHLRALAGSPLVCIMGLLIAQSIIGGFLSLSGTSTQWLFIHLGMATAIVACIVWTLLLLLRGSREGVPSSLAHLRRPTLLVGWVALIAIFVQILMGGLAAGSRQHGLSTTWPTMNGEWVPALWDARATLFMNLFDNSYLHQWLHRWFAAIVCVLLIGMAFTSKWAKIGVRGQIARHFVMSCLLAQMALGILNVYTGASPMIALAHLVMALLMVSGMVIFLFDLQHEDSIQSECPNTQTTLSNERVTA